MSLNPWVVTAGGPGVDRSFEIATDSSGDICIVGSFAASIDFGPDQQGVNQQFQSLGGNDGFVAKYSPDGTLQWARQIGGTGDDVGKKVVVDSDGFAYVAGRFGSTADFDLTSSYADNRDIRASRGYNDVFLLKLGPDGSFRWVQKAGCSSADYETAVALGSNGQIYLTVGGSQLTDLVCGDDLVPSGTGRSVVSLLVEVPDGDGFRGDFVWAKKTGDPSADIVDIAIDGSGAIYAAGYYWSTGNFGTAPDGTPVILTNRGTVGSDVFLLKLNSSGEPLWADGLGGTLGDETYDVAVDASGGVYVTGDIWGTVDFYRSGGQSGVPAVLSAGQDNPDAFILKVASDGSLVAAKKVGNTGQDYGQRMAVDSTGGIVYWEGMFGGTVAFGDQQLTSVGGADIFLAALQSSDLSSVSAYRAGGEGTDRAGGVAIDLTGMVYTTGHFAGTADFPTGDIRQSDGDVFLMNFDPTAGSISGNVFADIDGDGLNDDGIATPAGTIVYCDLDEDTVRDADEPKAITQGPSGAYTIAGLDYDNGSGGSVSYAVRQDVLPDGWTQTYPANNGSQTVVLSPTSRTATGVNFGNDFTTETKSYENKTKYTIKDNSVVSSKITVADSYAILDLNVKVNVTHSRLADLKVELIAPDGTTILLANTGAYPWRSPPSTTKAPTGRPRR